MVRARVRWAWGSAAVATLAAVALAVRVRGARAEAAPWDVVEGVSLPEAADGLPLRTVRPSGAPSKALRVREIVRDRGFFLVIDEARRLLALTRDAGGAPSVEVVAAGVRVAPLVLDGQRFVYVRPPEDAFRSALDPAEGPVDLLLRERGQERVLARAERITALLGARAGELLFVAEDPHGAPGLRAVALASERDGEPVPAARCLTNCALGPEGARDPRFEDLPATLAEAPR